MDKERINRLNKINIFATVLVAVLLLVVGYHLFEINLNYILPSLILVIMAGGLYNVFLNKKRRGELAKKKAL
ncbi:MAG: hypothetical protein R6W73_08735 [Candidatus Saliniplasma sp.]